MPFDMYGDVILTRDVTERGLRAGDVGTVGHPIWSAGVSCDCPIIRPGTRGGSGSRAGEDSTQGGVR